MTDAWGIADGFHDIEGTWHPTPDHARIALREAMGAADAHDPYETPPGGMPMWFVPVGRQEQLLGPCDVVLEDGTHIGTVTQLPPDLPIGYHELAPADGGPWTRLVVHPEQCPAAPRAWGVACQTYSLWSDQSWGIGDLRDVATLAKRVSAAGGGAMLLSPLHAPHPAVPQDPSPYYASSRRYRNPLLIPLDGTSPVPNDGPLVDRDAAWTAKRGALEARFEADRWEPAWRAWAREQGEALWRFASWCAVADDHGPLWRAWPEQFRHPSSSAITDRAHDDPAIAARIEFHAWLQWRIDQALAEAADAGAALIGDLAVGFATHGADAWEFQDQLALDVVIGAPPDPFSAHGQDWGLPGFVPWKLRADGYRAIVETARLAFRHLAGMRIDHVMGLYRQFWIPPGGEPADGAYVHFPGDELLAIIAIEATRAGAFIIGEDLGTVQPSVREAMARAGVLGTKVLWFEPLGPESWPEASLATITTHDLPTIAGVWSGVDGDTEMRERLEALTGLGPDRPAVQVAAAAHRHLLDSPARLRLVTAEDLSGTPDRPNEPSQPLRENWCRRLPVPVERLLLPHAATRALAEEAPVPEVGLEPTRP
ncbi:MAG: 4-alpha-glucanotransferase [Ilumatobacteraceae bacterium]